MWIVSDGMQLDRNWLPPILLYDYEDTSQLPTGLGYFEYVHEQLC